MRYRSFGELELSVASVRRFAIGVNRIYVITSGEKPSFDTSLRIIPHSRFIPKSRLPTFSTHSIHAHLYRLSRRFTNPFVLFDDDIMLTQRIDLRREITHGINYLASEGLRWPIWPLQNTTFARGVQNSVWAIKRRLGNYYPRQHVPAHTPQICYFETLIAVSRIFKKETLQHQYNPFRSLHECNMRVLWNAVDRKFETCKALPGNQVSHFLEMGVNNVKRFSSQLCGVRDAPKQYLTINDAILSTNPETIEAYTQALDAFYVWLRALYASNSTYRSARPRGEGMQCYRPPPRPPLPPSPPSPSYLRRKWCQFHKSVLGSKGLVGKLLHAIASLN